MATIYEVSELAGVSLATVSRVLNQSERVSARTREKVEEAMRQLDYRPNSIAQSLASSRTNSVGVLVPELHGPFFGTLLSGIEAELRSSGKSAVITVGHSDEARERAGIEFLASRKCDALILQVDAVKDEYLIELARSTIPIVLINRLIPAIESQCISLDDEHGGYVAAKHIANLGHRKIAYIAGPLWKLDASQRLAGHRRALAESGISFNPDWMVEGDYHESSGKAGLATLLNRTNDKDERFTAVICGNDEMAAGVMEQARHQGIGVPWDLSVVGFDNVRFTRYLHPKLTTVDYPMEAMGQMAARWVLKNAYDQPDLEIQNIFHPDIIHRDSTTGVATDKS